MLYEVLFFVFMQISCIRTTQEVVYVISGSGEFGGHIEKWFHRPIRDIISLTSQYFDRSTKFGILWTSPQPNSTNSFEIVSPLNVGSNLIRSQIDIWLNKESKGAKPTKWTGLRGSLEFAKSHMFSETEGPKIIIALTHMNVLLKEIDLFFSDKCNKGIMVSTIVFPKPWLNCDEKQLQKVLQRINEKLMFSGYFRSDFALCGRNVKKIKQLASILESETNNFKKMVTDFCPTPTPPTTTPTPTTPPTTAPPTTTPKPTPILKIIVEPGCQAFWCQKWLRKVYFFENAIVLAIAVIIICILCCRCEKKPKKSYCSLEAGLKMHQEQLASQSRRMYEMAPYLIGMGKRRASKGSIASKKSRKSMAKIKMMDKKMKEDVAKRIKGEKISEDAEKEEKKSILSRLSRKSSKKPCAGGDGSGIAAMMMSSTFAFTQQAAPADISEETDEFN